MSYASASKHSSTAESVPTHRRSIYSMLVAGLFAAAACTSSTAESASLKLGSEAPQENTAMKSVDGKKYSLADVAGDAGTLVIFTCNHCPYAKAWEGRIAELGNTYMDKGVGVIAVNPNDPKEFPEDAYDVMKTRAQKVGFEFPYVVDEKGELAKAFGATRTPEAFLFDGSGELVYHGTIDDNYSDASAVEKTYLEDALSAVSAGKEIPVAQTKAIGCSIKFPG